MSARRLAVRLLGTALAVGMLAYAPAPAAANTGGESSAEEGWVEEGWVEGGWVEEPVPDSDGDGVLDDSDQCPFQPGAPDAQGCPPVDSDGDGIHDDSDQCPGQPGTFDYGGCPVPDQDGDGLTDDVDACPTLPGPYDGCPLTDLDGDGTYDDGSDQCPNQAGPPEYLGCPAPDGDGDGISDSEDNCPAEAGLLEYAGCPAPDSDGDGHSDAADGCPGTPQGENVDSAGCSLTQMDADNDGYNDEVDQCDDSPDGAELDQSGCAVVTPPDNPETPDGGGDQDSGEVCPDGSTSTTGCPSADADDDGVEDGGDQCGDTPSAVQVDADGCPLAPSVQVTPAPVGFTDLCGHRDDTVTVPASEGVSYFLDGEQLAYGIVPAQGAVVVEARPQEGYELRGPTAWEATFTRAACPEGQVVVASKRRRAVEVDNGEQVLLRFRIHDVVHLVPPGESVVLRVASGRTRWVARWDGELSRRSGSLVVQ